MLSALPTAGLLAALFIIYQYLSHTKRRIASHIPQPTQPPWYKRLLREPGVFEVEDWTHSIPNEGLIRYHGILNRERILVTSPQGVRDVLSSSNAYSFEKPAALQTILKRVLGEGLVTAEGKSHVAQRSLLQPVFNMRSIKDMYPLFWEKTAELVGMLKNGGDHFSDLINRATLDIIGAAGFGLELNSLTNPENQFLRDYTMVFIPSPAVQRLRMLAFLFPQYVLDRLPIKRNKELRKASDAVGTLIREAIAERRRENKNDSKRRGKDIISVLFDTGAIQDVKALVHQSLTFLGAGHETVSQTLNWAIYELSTHPEAQERLRQEVRSTLPHPLKDNVPPTKVLEQLNSMPYLSAICNETLRLHPVIPHLNRQSIQPVKVAGVDFAKGTNFVVTIGGMNRSPELWEVDPSIFDPERWMKNANGGVSAREGFISFGLGPRTCIGERFARAEMGFLLAGIVACFEMRFMGTEYPKVEHGVVARFVDPLAVEFRALDAW